MTASAWEIDCDCGYNSCVTNARVCRDVADLVRLSSHDVPLGLGTDSTRVWESVGGQFIDGSYI